MIFTPRLERPKDGNPYYNTPDHLGYNPGRPAKGRTEKGLTALPNCVSWAEGRFNEIAGTKSIKWLGPLAYYPYAMIGKAKSQGLKISQTPTLGGMLVWTGGPTGEGHVDICEVIKYKNGKISSIITSDSEYYGRAFATFERTGKNWEKGCYWMVNAKKPYVYQGCIVNPAVEDEMTYEEFKKMFDKAMNEDFAKRFEKAAASREESIKKKPASSDYAIEAIDWMKSEGLIVGDSKGNTMPQAPLTREQYAMIEYTKAKKK